MLDRISVKILFQGEFDMGKYFGTDGFRGTANENLTADHAYKVGRFLGWYFCELKKQRGDESPARIIIGKDTRRSSYMFEYSLVGGLTASGADAYLLHVTTTPSVAYISRVDSFDCGIMISASHNPYYDNGLKLINSQGEKMEESVIELVEAYLVETSLPSENHGTKSPMLQAIKSAAPSTTFQEETAIWLPHFTRSIFIPWREGRSRLRKRCRMEHGKGCF